MPDLRTVASDPEFYQLTPQERKEVAGKLDPEFLTLTPLDQSRVLTKFEQAVKQGQFTRPAAAATAPAPGGASEFGKGLASGKQTFGSSLQFLGALTGIDTLREWGEALRTGTPEDRAALTPRVSSIGDIRSPGQALDWVGYNLGNLIPSMGASVAGGIAGGAGGAALAGPAGGVVGGIAGAGGISYLLNAGEVYANLIDENVPEEKARLAAGAAGLPMALLDVIVPVKVAGKILWQPVKKAAGKQLAKTLGKEILKSVGEEAGTEAVQEVIGAGTEAAVGPKQFWTPETASRVLNSLAAGGLGGLAFGGAGEVGGRVRERLRPAGPPAAPAAAAPNAPPAPRQAPAALAITQAQNAALWARKAELGLADEPFRAIVQKVSGQDLTKGLTGPQATQVLDELGKVQPPAAKPAAAGSQWLDRASDFARSRDRVNITALEKHFGIPRPQARQLHGQLVHSGVIDNLGRVVQAQQKLVLPEAPPEGPAPAQPAPPPGAVAPGEALAPREAGAAPPPTAQPAQPTLYDRAEVLARKHGKLTKVGIKNAFGVSQKQADLLMSQLIEKEVLNPIGKVMPKAALAPKQVPQVLQVTPAMPPAGTPSPVTPAPPGAPLAHLPAPPSAPEAAIDLTPDDLPPERVGSTEEVSTPEGTKIQAQWRIVDLAKDKIVLSHNYLGDENPEYPQQYQNRDRSRIASADQIRAIAANPNAKQLSRNYLTSEGAPIYANLGGRRVMITGNGRSLAIDLAYKQGTAEGYRAGLPEEIRGVGLDPKAIEGMERPALMRVLVGKTDLGRVARESNAPTVAERSPTELARGDARRLTGALLESFKPGEDGRIVTTENWPFIQMFFKELLSQGERGKYTLPNGGINQLGIARIRNAVFARAYGQSAALETVAEDPDDNVRNVTAAMLRAAPAYAGLGEAIAKGTRHDLNIAPEIARAAGKLSQLRAQGTTIEDYLNQEELFAPELSPLQRELLRVLGTYSRSAARMGEILTNYTDTVEALGNPGQASLVGGTIPTRSDILQAAIETAEAKVKTLAEQKKAKQDVQAKTRDDAARSGPGAGGVVKEAPEEGPPPGPAPPVQPAQGQQAPVAPPQPPAQGQLSPESLQRASEEAGLRLEKRGLLGGERGRFSLRSVTPRRGQEGFFATPSGEIVALDEVAQHATLGAFQGKSLSQVLRQGYVRARGNGLEIQSWDAVKPDVLRAAAERAGANSATLYVDLADRSLVYDTSELEAADWNLRRVRPIEGFLRSDTGTLDPHAFLDAATVGAEKIRAGATGFGTWSKQMVTQFGEAVRSHLLRLWRAAQRLHAAYKRSGLGSERGSMSLFGEAEEAAARASTKVDQARLQGERLTAEFASPLTPANLRKKLKRGEQPVQGGLFEAPAEKARQAGLFGEERGSLSPRPKVDEYGEFALPAKQTVFGDAIDLVIRPAGAVVSKQGEAGEALMYFVNEAKDAGDVEAGKRLVSLQDSGVTKLSKEDRIQLLDILEGRTPGTAELRRVGSHIRALTDEIGSEAENLGVEILAGGRKVPFVRLQNYFPHVIRSMEQFASRFSPLRRDVIDNLVRLGIKPNVASAKAFLDDYLGWLKDGGRRDSLIEHLIQTGQADNRLEATRLLARARKDTTLKHGSLEFAREIELPFYDPDPARVLPHWVASASQRLESIRVFGQKGAQGDLVQGLIESIRESGGDVNYVEKAVERMLGRVNDLQKGQRIGAFLRTVQGFKLGLAAIPNATQGALNSLLYGDLQATAAGFKGILTKEGRRFGMRSGASIDSVLNEMTRAVGSEWHPLGVYLKAVGFSGSERLNRIFAANAGANYAGRLAKRLRINPNDKTTRARMEELGIDPDQVRDGQLTGDQILMAAKKFSDITQFRSRPQDLPLWASSPAGKIFFQFKTFIYSQARLVGRTTIGEARRGNFGRAARNLLILATVFPLTGEAIGALRSLVTGRDRDVEGWDRYLDDIGQVGALGILNDIFESVKYGGTLKWTAGPAPGQVAEIADAALRIGTAKDPLKAAANFGKVLLKQIPLAGQVRRRILPGVFPAEQPKKKSLSPETRRLMAGAGGSP